MKSMKKMSLFLNLAKLVRFQRTNQAWIDPVYDASLHVFSPKDAVDVTAKYGWRLFPQIKADCRKMGYICSPFRKVPIHFVHMGFRMSLPNRKESGEGFGKVKQKQFRHEFSRPTHQLFAEIFIFFRGCPAPNPQPPVPRCPEVILSIQPVNKSEFTHGQFSFTHSL